MKRNLTTLMAAAFAVAMLFTSCGKTDDNTTNNGGNGDNGGSTPSSIAKVTFNGNTWTASDFYADLSQVGSNNRIIVGGSTDWNDPNVPYFQGFMGSEAGTFYKADGYTIGYFENESDVDAEGYGNWTCTAGTQNITDLDLNAKTISATTNQTMKNDRRGETDIAMKVTLTDAQWRVADFAKCAKGNKILGCK